MKTIPKININSCNLSNQQSEILSLWDIFNITFRLKKLYISDIQLEINNEETRIDILIIVFIITIMYPIFIRLFYGILGFIISYQLYYKYGASKTGELVFGMLKFSKVHIHHC
jgi:nitrate reductase NapE component